ELQDLTHRQALRRRQALAQRLSLEKLHHDELTAFVFSDVVDGTDVRVVQARGGARLALKTLDGDDIGGRILGQKFQGHHAAETAVPRLVDDSHPTASHLFEDVVVGHRLSEHAEEASAALPSPSRLLSAADEVLEPFARDSN